MHIFLPRIMNEKFSIIIIVFFQFFGTMLFGYMNLNIINAKATYKDNNALILIYNLDFALSLFMCLSYGRQFSGGIYNPAIVFYRQLRKTDRLTFKIGITYQISQYLGGTVGCLIAVYMNDLNHAPIQHLLDSHTQISKFFTEILGTFILSFMVQMLIQKKMTFIEHNRQFFIAIPLIFMISRGYSQLSNGLNPALGFAFQFAYACKTGKWYVFEMIYILILGPYIGALIAVFSFQYGLKPLYPYKKQQIQQILQQVLVQNQKKMREIPEIKESNIIKYRQNYKIQALKLGIELQSSKQNQGSTSLFPTKVINHRWSLGDTLTQEPMNAPINFQQFKNQHALSVIGQEYIDQDISSISSQQQEIPFIKKKEKPRFQPSFQEQVQINHQWEQNIISSFYEKFSFVQKSIRNQEESFSEQQSQSQRQSSSQRQSLESQSVEKHDESSQKQQAQEEQQQQQKQQQQYQQQNDEMEISYQQMRRKYIQQHHEDDHQEQQSQSQSQSQKQQPKSQSQQQQKKNPPQKSILSNLMTKSSHNNIQ